MIFYIFFVQNESNGADPEISKREKVRLKEMQKLKKQKIQEILDAQNAAIDADMVRVLWKSSYSANLRVIYGSLMFGLMAE